MMSTVKLLLIIFVTTLYTVTSQAQFLQPKRIFANYEVSDLKSFDVDHDGLNDLVIFSWDAWVILYRKNLGGGAYSEPKVIFDALSELDELFEKSFVMMDKDLDGDTDILMVSWTKLIILENHNSYFEPELVDIGTYFYGDEPFLVAHDADQDGDEDIFIHDANVGSSAVQIKSYENNGGDFVFANSISLTGFAPFKINFYDYNQDGNKDLLVYKSSTSQLRVYNYQSPFVYSGVLLTINGVDAIEKLVVADFENDGDDDILEVGTCMSYFKSNGPSNIGAETSTECNNWRSNYADFNNDGKIDAVSFDDDNDSLQIYKNNGVALQLVQSYFLEPMNLTETYVADVNNDGLVDILTSDDYSTVRIYINQGAFSFLLESVIHAPSHASMTYYGNIENGGMTDFMTVSPRQKMDGTVYSAFRSFSSFPDAPDSFQEFVPADSITYFHYTIGNVDNDGLDDILAIEAISKDFVWFKNLGGSFDAPAFIYDNNFFMVSSIMQSFQDIDGDSDLDIISYDNMSADFIFLLNDGLGSYTAENWSVPFSYNANVIFRTCNLNNDGFPDFIFWDGTPDEARVYQSSTLSSYDEILFVDSTTSFVPYLTVDLDQDLHDEILIKGQTDFYILNVDSVSNSLQMIADLTSNSTKWLELDYDYDGYPELLAPQYLSEPVFIYPNSAGMVNTHQAIGFGSGQSNPILVDFDSDADLDLYSRDSYSMHFINENIGGSNFSINGANFLDANGNGIYDSSDIALNLGGLKLESENQNMFYPVGVYKFYVDSGVYDLSSMLDTDPFWVHTTDSVYSFILGFSNQIETGLDFGVLPNGIYVRNDVTAASFGCISSNSIWLNHTYIGSGYQHLLFELELHPNMAFDSVYFPIDSVAGNSIYWSNDSVNYFSSSINELSFYFDTFTPANAEVSIYYRIFGVDSLGVITELNTDTLTELVTCSLDPNDKTAYPFGLTDEHYITANQDLTYTIRFQNTGTDTAHTVMIVDYLSEKLNWSEFEFIASSDPCVITIDAEGLMLATFEDIMLPDSNVNEPASHGFLKFRIGQDADLQSETMLTNKAEIYFDLNEPVITNTVFHTIYSCYDLVENLALPDPAYCDNELLVAELSPDLLDSIQWNLNGQYLSGQQEFSTDTLMLGIHNLQLLAWNPYCSLDSTITITIHPFTQVSVLNGEEVAICPGDSTLLESSFATSNQWIFGGESIGGSNEQMANAPGIYFLVNGTTCQSVDSVLVDLYTVYQDTVDEQVCQGDSLLIGDSYYSLAGYYPDTLTTVNGCDSIIFVHLTTDLLSEVVSVSGYVLNALQVGVSYQWIDCSGNTIIPGAVNQSFSPVQDGVYAVILNNGSCIDTSSCFTITGLNAVENLTDVSPVIYPNPASHNITVYSPVEGQVVIISVSGAAIFSSFITSGEIVHWDCSTWANGIYMVLFKSDNSTSQKMVVVSH